MSVPQFSVVIPVYNSDAVVAETLAACVDFFEERNLTYEIIAVNDGSTDDSWQVLRRCTERWRHLLAVDLLRNYGQHTAVICGLNKSRGDYVITLDDDMQNPPQEIVHLLAAAESGHDVVFGRPEVKRHSLVRRLGSSVINSVNTRIFRKPPDLVLTNFRLLERRVVERILSHRTQEPYINGLSVLYARSPVNVPVEHRSRKVGASNYSLVKIFELVTRILFNYSSFPLRFVSALGIALSAVGLLMAGWVFGRALLETTSVPGWASVVVVLCFFNGFSLLLSGMLGEYTLRILQQVSLGPPFHVVEERRQGD